VVDDTSLGGVRLQVERAAPGPGQPLEEVRFRCQVSGVPPEVLTGERLRLLARAYWPRRPQNPGEPDQVERDRDRGIDLRAGARPGALLRLEEAPGFRRLAALARARFQRVATLVIADA